MSLCPHTDFSVPSRTADGRSNFISAPIPLWLTSIFKLPCRPRTWSRGHIPAAAGVAVVVGALQGNRPQQRGERFRATAGVARQPAAGARCGRTRMVGIVRVEAPRHPLRGDVESLLTDCLFEGLEVRHVGASGTDERIDFGPDSATSAAPQPLLRSRSPWPARGGEPTAGASRSPSHSRSRVWRNASTSASTADFKAANISSLKPPFFGSVSERFRQSHLGHGQSPPTRGIGRSALARYRRTAKPSHSCRAPAGKLGLVFVAFPKRPDLPKLAGLIALSQVAKLPPELLVLASPFNGAGTLDPTGFIGISFPVPFQTVK